MKKLLFSILLMQAFSTNADISKTKIIQYYHLSFEQVATNIKNCFYSNPNYQNKDLSGLNDYKYIVISLDSKTDTCESIISANHGSFDKKTAGTIVDYLGKHVVLKL
ncbi:MAG: hypothetical protein ACI92O_001585 [Colwellia sp.]|jgi:hypothetical protein|tara:strand:- start:13382 stop:13702 length:321 start_codon:yes stop_codon:yes gene_type:complete